MTDIPYAEFVVLLFGVLGFIPSILEFRHSRTSRLFFGGFTAAVVGIILLNIALLQGDSTLLVASHIIGIMIPGLLFMIWAQHNYNEQFAFRRRMEKFSKEDK